MHHQPMLFAVGCELKYSLPQEKLRLFDRHKLTWQLLATKTKNDVGYNTKLLGSGALLDTRPNL
jgi:hypothetical protein